MKRKLLSLLVIVVTAAVSGGAVYFWQSSQFKDQISVLKGDNASLKLQVNDLQASASQTAAMPPPPPPPPAADTTPPPAAPAASDQDAVIAIVKAACDAKAGDASKSSYGVAKLDPPFAWVNFNCHGTGNNRSILKQTGTSWAIIYTGTKAPPAATINQYAIPKAYQ